jgi:hypothetical protein
MTARLLAKARDGEAFANTNGAYREPLMADSELT